MCMSGRVFTCVFLIPECHQKASSIPALSVKYEGGGGRDMFSKWKTTTWSRGGAFFLSVLFFFSVGDYSFLFICPADLFVFLFLVQFHILHFIHQSGLSSSCLPFIVDWMQTLQRCPDCPECHTMHTYVSRCRTISPACSLMNAARCFVEEGSFSLINVSCCTALKTYN